MRREGERGEANASRRAIWAIVALRRPRHRSPGRHGCRCTPRRPHERVQPESPQATATHAVASAAALVGVAAACSVSIGSPDWLTTMTRVRSSRTAVAEAELTGDVRLGGDSSQSAARSRAGPMRRGVVARPARDEQALTRARPQRGVAGRSRALRSRSCPLGAQPTGSGSLRSRAGLLARISFDMKSGWPSFCASSTDQVTSSEQWSSTTFPVEAR